MCHNLCAAHILCFVFCYNVLNLANTLLLCIIVYVFYGGRVHFKYEGNANNKAADTGGSVIESD